MPACRSCGSPIVFVRMADTGNPMPCNPGPDERANIACRRRGTGYVDGHVITETHPAGPDMVQLLAHWAVCEKRGRTTKTPTPKPAAEPRLF